MTTLKIRSKINIAGSTSCHSCPGFASYYILGRAMGARLVHTTYQKYTKLPQYVNTKCLKIYQHLPLPYPPKFTQLWIFGLKLWYDVYSSTVNSSTVGSSTVNSSTFTKTLVRRPSIHRPIHSSTVNSSTFTISTPRFVDLFSDLRNNSLDVNLNPEIQIFVQFKFSFNSNFRSIQISVQFKVLFNSK
jgi:hypothetical protein